MTWKTGENTESGIELTQGGHGQVEGGTSGLATEPFFFRPFNPVTLPFPLEITSLKMRKP